MNVEATILTEAQQLHDRHTQELQSYKADLQQLKTAFFKRQIDKGRLIPAAEQLAQLSPVADHNNPEHDVALNKLLQIVARALVDPSCQGITAADTLHKKVCKFTAVRADSALVVLSCRFIKQQRHLTSHCAAFAKLHSRQQLTPAFLTGMSDEVSCHDRPVVCVYVQILAGRHATEYRAAMGVLRQPDLARLMYHFSQLNCLQCSLLDINGNLLLCVHNIDTDALRT
jgi:hypothetical protein